ncbi:MAG: hypothetical protein CL678_00210 [Bdellovibrionaceae bacterium]|nr:hypothetical protein [Pseudobdellovibrionaceae bacterium]|tara:strand:- start:1995 stop:2456 length:462 start_codon:yes stop_codon:yes gene_type:complete
MKWLTLISLVSLSAWGWVDHPAYQKKSVPGGWIRHQIFKKKSGCIVEKVVWNARLKRESKKMRKAAGHCESIVVSEKVYDHLGPCQPQKKTNLFFKKKRITLTLNEKCECHAHPYDVYFPDRIFSGTFRFGDQKLCLKSFFSEAEQSAILDLI